MCVLDLFTVAMWVFVFACAGLIIFAIVSEIRDGRVSYVVFCGLLLCGIGVISLASSELGSIIRALFVKAGVYIAEETAEKASLAVILLWCVAVYLFYKYCSRKK